MKASCVSTSCVSCSYPMFHNNRKTGEVSISANDVLTLAPFSIINDVLSVKPSTMCLHLTPKTEGAEYNPLTDTKVKSEIIAFVDALSKNPNYSERTNIRIYDMHEDEEKKLFNKCHYWKAATILGSRGNFFPCTSKAIESYASVLWLYDVNDLQFNFWSFWEDAHKWDNIALSSCPECTRTEFGLNYWFDEQIYGSSKK